MGKIDILFENRQRTFKPDLERLTGFMKAVMGQLWPGKNLELSLSLVGPKAMAKTNRAWLGVQGSTDQLSFPLLETRKDSEKELTLLLGDLVLCPQVISRQASSPSPGGRPKTGTFEKELGLVIIHGLLHLAGHDHTDPASEKKMVLLESKLYENHIKALVQ